MPQDFDNIYLEAKMLAMIDYLTETEAEIRNRIPPEMLFGMNGELNLNTKWGMAVFNIRHSRVNLKSMFSAGG